MRYWSVILVLAGTVDAAAQEPPPPSPPSSVIVESSPSPSPSAASTTTASTTTASTSIASTSTSGRVSASATVELAAPRRLSPVTVGRWRSARALQVAGGAIGLISTGLSLASTIYIVATGYPPSANSVLQPAKPSDIGPALAYAGSGGSALGFALSAGGLGWQHSILREIGADPGRGTYVGGTVIGIVGVLAVGAGYFMALTDYMNPHDQSIAVLTTSLSGAALCTTASILYAVDSSRMKKVWKHLSSF